MAGRAARILVLIWAFWWALFTIAAVLAKGAEGQGPGLVLAQTTMGLVLLAAAFVALLKKPVVGYVLMLMAAAVTIPFIGLVLGNPVVLAMLGVPPLLAGVVLVVESNRARPKPPDTNADKRT